MLATLLGVLVFSASAADITGKWTAQVPGRGGQTQETTFNLKADGDMLTGAISTQRGEMPISDGKISGDNISFTVKMSFQGNEMKMLYKGTVSGDQIKFTRTREGADRTQEFTAKRSAT
jgi:hypothetical protein